jgi:hypothetical protein
MELRRCHAGPRDLSGRSPLKTSMPPITREAAPGPAGHWQRARSRWLAAAACVVSLGLVTFLLARIDPTTLRDLARSARGAWIVAAAACVAVLPPLMTWRWQTVLQSQGASRLPFARLLQAVLMGNILNSFLPGKSGDLVKAFYLREHAGLAWSVGSVLLERTVDVAVLGLLGLGAYAITGYRWGLVTAGMLLGGAAAAFLVLRFVPVDRWLPGRALPAAASFRGVWQAWSSRPALAAQTVLASLLIWLLCGSVLGCLALALRQPLSWLETFAVFPLAIMAGLVPVTISGLGTREAVMTELLVPMLSRDAATLLSLGYTALTYWFLSALSLPAVWLELRQWRARQSRIRADEAGPSPPTRGT